MATGKVSLCIPTFNGATYLDATLDSACSQTWADLEILIVDDCSSDQTLAIASSRAVADPRIRVVQNPKNLGLVGNWNRCIELAQGDWIKFLFQDDLLEPDCVKQMMRIADRPVVFCSRDFIFEDCSEEKAEEYGKFLLKYSINGVFGGDSDISADRVCIAVLEHPNINFFGEPTCCLIHKGVFTDIGIYDSRLIQLCDLEFVARAGIHTGFSYASNTLAHFRVHGQSATASNTTRNYFRTAVIDALLILETHARNPSYEPLRRMALSKGIDLEKRLQDISRYEQLWGRHWDLDEWDEVIMQFPFLRLPVKERLKRGIRRWIGKISSAAHPM